MKTKISLLLFLSICMLSFTTKKNDTTDFKTHYLTENNFSHLVNVEIKNDASSYTLDINWLDDALFGQPNYEQVRADIREHYENFWGKSVFSAILDNNSERWLFNGVMPKSSVEGSMSKNDDVEPDDGN